MTPSIIHTKLFLVFYLTNYCNIIDSCGPTHSLIVRKDVYDLHQAILVLITGVLIDVIKDVGRPRPDFFWHCFPDDKGVFDTVTSKVMCTRLKSINKGGHKGFSKWAYILVLCWSWFSFLVHGTKDSGI